MSNIDKQALRISELEELNELLREKVKKLESDLWDKEQLRQVYSEKSFNLDSKVRELEARNQKDFVWRGNEISRLNDEVDELKEKLEAAEKRNAEQREYYEGVIADGSKRIAELENSETQLINERDAAESAPADMYQAATGERPEWSNMFGFADAVDVVEERLATLEANQSQTTPTGIQLITEAIGAHGYIVGCLLQGRPDLALEESRKWVSAFGQAAEIVSAQDAAGIKVKES
ncbi:ead/Ea22-like family protein [Salmonella enterica]|nr:ead/Ea22-like family protein [Salmonella enterica]EDQ9357873.1 ead/Ea22-like family protein [Salmonella enterica]EGL5213764.1 ead/Ea22-like family protein [Salmonella enterica]